MQLLLGHCEIALTQHSSILLSLFLAGLFGGFIHCAGMCVPFVIAQVKYVDENDTILKKLSGASLLPYHFGRMTTYIFLGIIAAMLSRQIIGTQIHQGLSFLFLTMAGLVFIGSALPQVKIFPINFSNKSFSKIGVMIGKIVGFLFKNPTKLQRYCLGLLLGLMPCGLVFASLMAISTTGNISAAVFGMSLFTIGTFPSMFLVGIFSNCACTKWPNGMQRIARGVMVFNGLSLFILAGNIVL